MSAKGNVEALTSDTFATDLFRCFLVGAENLEGSSLSSKLPSLMATRDAIRNWQKPETGRLSVQRFKLFRQAAHFFKRYRFTEERTEAYEQNLVSNMVSSFDENNVRLSQFHPRKSSTEVVLREARKIAREILTLPFEPSRYRKFGGKAQNGVPLELAYLDVKLADLPTCPMSLISAVKQEIRQLNIGNDAGCPEVRDYLRLTAVPKTWKTHRAITPLTTWGLYWSYGIGKYVELCLENYGLPIKKLQERHKKLAEKYSRTRTHVTADLSKASDSISRWLCIRILPRKIWNELKTTLVPYIHVQGRRINSSSCLPMGNAATFPIETLIFYCIIAAVGRLMKVDGTYSVYGDDMIYPRAIHRQVRSALSDCGILLNDDKTCVFSHFRESCGGDYFMGCDVRPFMFPEEQMPSGRLARLAYLYKVYNTLERRWSYAELPECFDFILSWIVMTGGKILIVPPSYPDTSGIKVDSPYDLDSSCYGSSILKSFAESIRRPIYSGLSLIHI